MPKGVYPGFEALSDFKLTYEVTFYENGTIKTARIDSDDWLKTPVGKIKIDSSVPVTFYENGTIKTACINSDDWLKTPVGKIKINSYENKPVTFYENGTFKSAHIQPQVFDTPLGLLTIEEIGIYPSGKIEYINPSSAVPLHETYTMYTEINEQGYGSSLQPIPKCDNIHFYENGIIKQLSTYYYESISINIEQYSYRINEIWFYEDGKPMGAEISSRLYDYIRFAPDGEFLGRAAVIDSETGLLREPTTPEENEEYERHKQRYYEGV